MIDEALLDALVEALQAECDVCAGRSSACREHWAQARASVRVLAETGRLLPPGARLVEELGVRVDREHPRRKEKAGHVMTHLCRESVLAAPKIWDGWTVVKRQAIKWAGPWEVLTDSKDNTDA